MILRGHLFLLLLLALFCVGDKKRSNTKNPLENVICDTSIGSYKNLDGEIRCAIKCVPSSVKVKPCISGKCPIITEQEISCPKDGTLFDERIMDNYNYNSDYYNYNQRRITPISQHVKCNQESGTYDELQGEIRCEYRCDEQSADTKKCVEEKTCETRYSSDGHEIICKNDKARISSASGILDSNKATCDKLSGSFTGVSGVVDCIIPCDPKSVTITRCKDDERCRPIITEHGITCPNGGTVMDRYGMPPEKGSACDTKTGIFNVCDGGVCDASCGLSYSQRWERERRLEEEKQRLEDGYNDMVVTSVGISAGALIIVAIIVGVVCCWKLRRDQALARSKADTKAKAKKAKKDKKDKKSKETGKPDSKEKKDTAKSEKSGPDNTDKSGPLKNEAAAPAAPNDTAPAAAAATIDTAPAADATPYANAVPAPTY